MPSIMPQHWRLGWQMALSVCDTILYYYSMIPWRRVLYNVPQHLKVAHSSRKRLFWLWGNVVRACVVEEQPSAA
jgi:hypothetical protein